MGDINGKSEDKPIRILDVTIEEFEEFLWVFYNPYVSLRLYLVPRSNPVLRSATRYRYFGNYDAPIASWFSILKLAHRWDFPIVKSFALRELKRREREVPLARRICLYQDYGAPPEYLVPLYGELCARDLTPTEEEAAELGFERTYRIFKARELLRSPVKAGMGDGGPLSPLPKGMREEDSYPAIEEVFELPPYPLVHDGDN